MRRAVVASAAGLGVMGSLLAPAALPLASPVSGVAAELLPPSAEEPRLVFSGEVSAGSADSAADVWDVPVDGGGPRRLVDTSTGDDGPLDDTHPSYSPDGTRVVLTAAAGDEPEAGSRLHVADLTTGQPAADPFAEAEPLDTGWVPGIADSEPDWSPEGDRIVFIRTDPEGGGPRLRVLDLETATVTDPLEAVGAVDVMAMSPAWSPDGARILFVVPTEGDVGEVWVLDEEAGELRPLVESTEDGLEAIVGQGPAWSPDGTQLAYVDPGSGALVTAVLEEPAGTPDAPVLTEPDPLYEPPDGVGALQDLRDPSWSPDGTEVTVAAFEEPAGKDPAGLGLFAIPVAGGDYRTVVEPGAWVELDGPEHQPWSDLAVTLASSRTTGIGLGELVELTATVTNPGPSAAWGVSVEYELPGGPEGMDTAVGWPQECSGDGGSLTCVLDEPLPPGGTAELTVTVAVPEPGAYRTDVRVDALTVDPLTADNVATVGLEAPFPPATGTEPRLAFSYRHSTADDRRADIADVLAADASDFRILVDERVDDGDDTALPVEEHPSYSPDGRRLVFSSERHELDDGELPDRPTLFVADVGPDGARNVALLEAAYEEGASAIRPAWSPDGTRIAYLRQRGGGPTLSILELATGSVQDWEVPATDFTWSPDGERLVVANPNAQPGPELAIVDGVDGTTYGVLTEDTGCSAEPEACRAPVIGNDPAWAPDGDRIAYTARAGDDVDGLYTVTLGDPTTTGEEVYLVPAPQLVSEPDEEDHPLLREPTWALDGSSVTVVGHDWEGPGSLLSVPADGGPATLVRDMPGIAPDVGDPVYQPWADVAVELASTAPVDAGQPATVTATVTNLGPSPAWHVGLTVELPAVAAGDAVLETWPEQCAPDAAGLSCVLDEALPVDVPVVLTVALRFTATGAHPVRAELSTASVDPQPGNDAAVVSLEVREPPEPVLEPHLAFTRWAGEYDSLEGRRDVADVPAPGGAYARLLAHRTVTTDEGQVLHLDEQHPAYSPDGTRLALSAAESLPGRQFGLDQRLAVGELATEPVPAGDPPLTDLQLLTYPTEPGQSDVQPVWSPDGTRIAFTRQDTWYSSYRRVLVLDVATGTVRELELPGGAGARSSDPSWAPDGERLAVVVGQLDNGPGELWIVHLDDGSWYPAGTQASSCSGGPIECLEPVAAVAPAWSPGGTQVAAGDGTVFGDAPEYSAVVVHDIAPEPVDGFYAVTASRALAGRPADAEGEQPPGTLEAAWHPAWSPDGTEVALVGRQVDGRWPALYAVPAGGGTPEVRVSEWGDDAPGGYGDPTYQPWSDVGITLRPPADPVVADVPAEMTAVVTNAGPSPAWGLTVRFTLPAGQRVVDVPAGCAVSDASATCTEPGPLAPGADLELTVTVVLDEPGEHEVTGAVTATTLDPVPANDAASTVVVVEPRVPGAGVEPRLAFGYVPDLGRELPSDLADVFWADGEEFRVLADERPTDPLGQPHRAHETHPTYSPDGRRLAFSADRELVGDGTGGSSSLEGRQRLMVGTTRPGTTGLVDVSPLDYARDPAASDEEPAWSPDGTRLAFVRSFGEGRSLALVDLATGDVRLLDVGLPSSVAAPTWSPDGTRLAVEAGGQLWVVDVDGEEASPVVVVPETCAGPPGSCDQPLTGRSPAWSPDGTRLAFVAPDDIYFEALSTVAVAEAPENGAYRVAAPLRVAGPGDQSWYPADPDWSLDGTSIAFVARGAGPSGADALLTVPAAGGEPVVLREDVVPGLRHGFADLDHQPWADLGVTVTASDTEVETGEQVDVTVTATNDGPSPAWGVRLDIALPGGGEHLVGVPAGCASTDTGLRCVAPQAVAVGATHTVTVPLEISVAGSHVTRATVTSRMIDPLGENDTAQAAVEVVAPPRITLVSDVAVRVELERPTAWVGGDPVGVRLVVTNEASGPATGVSLTLAHPDAVTAGPDACLEAAPCLLGTLPPGGSRTVVVAVEPVTAGAGPVSATVTTTALDLDRTNDTDAADLTVLQPELRLLPSVGEPGEATLAYGTDFPPGARLTLSWAPGLTAWVRPVTVAADGTVRSPLLVLPGDLLGERVATATWESGPGFGDVPAPPMLVVPETSAPPDFLTRG